MGSTSTNTGAVERREDLFRVAVAKFGRVLDRIAAGYEANVDKRRDLRQEIDLQLWRSLETFDGRCSLKTWTLRVAHNTAVSHVSRERRWNSRYRSIEELESCADHTTVENGDTRLDRERALERLYGLIRELKPLDRQIIISWLEDLDATTISEITGLSPSNVAMKVHRIRKLLTNRVEEQVRKSHA